MNPNFLLIQLDQLSIRALQNIDAIPNINSLLDSGTSFETCTCQFPLCQPSRASLWSGMYPHKTDVLSNDRLWPNPEFPTSNKTLGEMFSDNGYTTVHFGKKHDKGTLRGFECADFVTKYIPDDNPAFPFNKDTYHDVATEEQATMFLSQYNFEKPLVMAVDFVNPHNICGYVGLNNGEHENAPYFPLPELPENFDFDDIHNRSKSIQYICCSHNRQAQTSRWKDEDFRYYLAAYYYYLSFVDTQVGNLIKALEETGKKEETIIVFFSDHGDGMASRRSVTKQVALYEELVSVPLAFSGYNIPRQTIQGLAANLDIAPTLCELAGIVIPSTFDGISLADNILNSKTVIRKYVSSQWHTEWGYTVSPSRMIRTQRYKYINYKEDDFEELYDLIEDPYEKTNIAKSFPEVLHDMQLLFKEYLISSKDPFMSLEADVDAKWRNHKLGYCNHYGIAAPQEVRK